MEFVILILALIGIVAIFFAGAFIDYNDGIVVPILLTGAMLILIAFAIDEDCVKEKSIRKYVNNELTYDTVSIDKEGKLLEIKVIKKLHRK